MHSHIGPVLQICQLGRNSRTGRNSHLLRDYEFMCTVTIIEPIALCSLSHLMRNFVAVSIFGFVHGLFVPLRSYGMFVMQYFLPFSSFFLSSFQFVSVL